MDNHNENENDNHNENENDNKNERKFSEKYTFIPETLTSGQKSGGKMGVFGLFCWKIYKKACIYKIFIVSLRPIS